MDHPRSVLTAALTYWAMVFAIAFALGVGRTVWLAPRVGALAAVACEVPLTLAASWFAAGALTRRHCITRAAPALAMGLCAFAILMAAELALARTLAGQSAREWLASLVTPPGALGLGGQVLFGLMPWWVTRRAR